jgi:hypothetical protein
MKRLVLVLMAVLALVAVGGTMSAEAARGGPGRGPGGTGGTGPQERPAAAGSVASVDGATITVTTDQGSVKVVTSGSTTFEVNRAQATLADIKAGQFLCAFGTKNSDGSVTATRVQSGPARPQGPPQGPRGPGGQVASIDGATINVSNPQGSVKIVTSSSTTFEVNGARAGLSDIKTGMFVRAEGTKSSDGSFAATRVVASTERPQRPQAPPQQ